MSTLCHSQCTVKGVMPINNLVCVFLDVYWATSQQIQKWRNTFSPWTRGSWGANHPPLKVCLWLGVAPECFGSSISVDFTKLRLCSTAVFITEKKSMYKRTHTVQTHIVQGSTVVLFKNKCDQIIHTVCHFFHSIIYIMQPLCMWRWGRIYLRLFDDCTLFLITVNSNLFDHSSNWWTSMLLLVFHSYKHCKNSISSHRTIECRI